MPNTGPLGQERGIVFVIVLSIVTLGIYSLYWTYKIYEEMRQHTGDGIGGVIGLVIALVIGVVNFFVIPSEVGRMYKGDGRQAPVTVDLSGLTFCDASGLGVLARSARYARQKGRQLALASARPSLLKIMRITGLDRAFPELHPAAHVASALASERYRSGPSGAGH